MIQRKGHLQFAVVSVLVWDISSHHEVLLEIPEPSDQRPATNKLERMSVTWLKYEISNCGLSN